MMAEFEENFPNKGFLVVIDEMLAYLKGCSVKIKCKKTKLKALKSKASKH